MNSCPAQTSVLVVDDDDANRLLFRRALEPLNVTVVTVGSGREALGLITEQRFATIVLDVQLPGLDGYETAAKIRDAETLYRTPIIFVTAHHTAHTEVARGYATGAVDYLLKPVNLNSLACKVQVFLDLHQQEMTVHRLNEELRQAMNEIRTLRGLLPICANCKKIRDGDEQWHRLESYLTRETEVQLTHDYCPECADAAQQSIKAYLEQRPGV